MRAGQAIKENEGRTFIFTGFADRKIDLFYSVVSKNIMKAYDEVGVHEGCSNYYPQICI